MKDEYAKVGVPMLPVVRGEAETRRQILLYTRPALRGDAAAVLRRRRLDAIYLVASLALGIAFIGGAVRLYRRADRRKAALRLYLFSLAYLAAAVRGDGRGRQAVAPSGRIAPVWTATSPARTSAPASSSGAVCFFMFGLTFVAAAIYVA